MTLRERRAIGVRYGDQGLETRSPLHRPVSHGLSVYMCRGST